METKSIQITPPKGYEVDKEHSTFEKIVFKPIDSKPRSWEEYCEQYKNIPCYTLGYDVSNGYWIRPSGIYEDGYCTIPSKELAEAFLAMMQLMSLRQAWIGNWEPNWLDSSDKWCIVTFNGKFDIANYGRVSRNLNFPIKGMAEEFLDCFKDLLEIAKPLV